MTGMSRVYAATQQHIYALHLYREGTSYWHILDVPSHKQPLLLRAAQGGEVDAERFGTVLASGWGEKIPASIRQQYGLAES